MRILGQRRRRVVVGGEELPVGAEAQRDGVVDGAIGIELGLLRHPADPGRGRDPALAVVEVRAAGEHLQQRRLAFAVAADQADALARIELEVGAVEQRVVAVGEAGAREREEGHASAISRGR